MSQGNSDIGDDHTMFPDLTKATPYSGMDFAGFPQDKIDGAMFASSSSAFPPLPGDFYCEPDEVVRSVCLDSSAFDFPDHLGKGGMMGNPGFPDMMTGDFYGGMSGLKSLDSIETFKKTTQEHASTASSSSVTFEKTDEPPAAPTDSFFQYQATTLYLSLCTASTIANSMLELFRTRMIASVLKVNRTKFTIKAEVVIGGNMCLLKIRMYKDDTRVVVEFQRRSGDVVVFNAAYRQAAAHLGYTEAIDAKAVTAEVLEANARADDLSLDIGDESMASMTVNPFIEMANQVHNNELQAEAATAIERIASQIDRLEDICNTFDALKTLLKTQRTDITHSVACTLTTLAQKPECAPNLLDPELITLVREKVNCAETGLQTRQKFTCVLQQ